MIPGVNVDGHFFESRLSKHEPALVQNKLTVGFIYATNVFRTTGHHYNFHDLAFQLSW